MHAERHGWTQITPPVPQALASIFNAASHPCGTFLSSLPCPAGFSLQSQSCLPPLRDVSRVPAIFPSTPSTTQPALQLPSS